MTLRDVNWFSRRRRTWFLLTRQPPQRAAELAARLAVDDDVEHLVVTEAQT